MVNIVENGDRHQPSDYTAFTDASWSITSRNMSTMMPHQKQTYEEFIRQCVDEDEVCDIADKQRLTMNAEQPGGMKNYTETGFKKIRAPAPLYKLLKDFWDKNRDKARIEKDDASCFHNSWQVPTTILMTEESQFEGGGWNLSAAVWASARDILEEWTGQKLAGSSVYGIRVYHNQSILTPHVDRLPLVSSAIINVDQEVDEDWVLEVYGHDGKATNVTMAPGDMVLYESHSVIHGRPFPLNGKFYANIFVHFETMGDVDSMEELPPKGSLPPYVRDEYLDTYFQDFPDGWTLLHDIYSMVRRGDLYTLRYVAQRDSSVINSPDTRCMMMRQAAENKHIKILDFLVRELEFDMNMLCKSQTPLDLVEDILGEGSPVVAFMVDNGARNYHDVHPDNVTFDDRCDVIKLAISYDAISQNALKFWFEKMNYDINMICDDGLTPLDLAYKRFEGRRNAFGKYLELSGGVYYDDLAKGDAVLENEKRKDSRCVTMKAAVEFGYAEVFDVLIDELNYDINTDCDSMTALDHALETWEFDHDLVEYLEEEDGITLQEHKNTRKLSIRTNPEERCMTVETAIKDGDQHVVEFLVTKMFYDVNMKCKRVTPLDMAVNSNLKANHPLVHFLLDRGGEFYRNLNNSQDGDGDAVDESTLDNGDAAKDEL